MSPRRADPPTIEYVILGLIRLQPTHGYDLIQTFQQEKGVGLIWQIKPGRLYALLDKLEDSGWLKSETKEGEDFLARKEYRLTPEGEDAFKDWLLTPISSAHRMRQDFLAQLYFAPYEGAWMIDEIINRQIETCKGWLTGLQHAYQNLLPVENYERLVLSFRIGQVEAMLCWLDSCKDNGQSSDRSE